MPTTLDRNIQPILPYRFQKYSSNLNLDIERIHRIHGTAIISQACYLLQTSPSTYATSCAIFHRFYHRTSLKNCDVWSTCISCTILSCKIEEDTRRIPDIILLFAHLYRRFRLEVGYSTNSSILENKLTKLRNIEALPRLGAVYTKWENTLKETEHLILRALGFCIYWIPGSHPHKFLLYFLRVLECEEAGQAAWNYCNDSCRLDLCVKYQPEIITCASIYLACLDKSIRLPMKPYPWWEVFVGPNRGKDLATVCNAMLALGDDMSMVGYARAMRTFVPSIVRKEKATGSFNDPGSLLWNSSDI